MTDSHPIVDTFERLEEYKPKWKFRRIAIFAALTNCFALIWWIVITVTKLSFIGSFNIVAASFWAVLLGMVFGFGYLVINAYVFGVRDEDNEYLELIKTLTVHPPPQPPNQIGMMGGYNTPYGAPGVNDPIPPGSEI